MGLQQPIILIPVQSNGTAHGIGCRTNEEGTHSTCSVVETSTYPSTFMGEFLRKLRVRRKLNLREAGDALGLSIVEFSELERGRYTLSADDWCRAVAAIHPGTMPWLTGEFAERLEKTRDVPGWPEELQAHVETATSAEALTDEQTDALEVLFGQRHDATYSEPFLQSLEDKLFGGMLGGGMTHGGGNRMFVEGSTNEKRLIHVEPLRPGPGEEELFARYKLPLDEIAVSFRIPKVHATDRDFNRGTAEDQLRFIENRLSEARGNPPVYPLPSTSAPTYRRYIQPSAPFGKYITIHKNRTGLYEQWVGQQVTKTELDKACSEADALVIEKDERTIQSMLDSGMIELRAGATARDAAVEYQLIKARAETGNRLLPVVYYVPLQQTDDESNDLDEDERESFPPEPICTCTPGEPLGPNCERAAGRKHGGKPRCPRPCSECSDGAHHFTDIGTVVAFDDDEVAGDSPETIAENKRNQEHPAAQAGIRVWYECYHCGAWVEFDAGDDGDDEDEDDEDDDCPDSQDWCDDCDNFLDECKCTDDEDDEEDDGEVGHNEPENLRQPVLLGPVLFVDDDDGELLTFDNALVAPYANDGHSKPTEDSATKCAEGCIIDDLDAVSGGEWHCGACGRFIPEYVVRDLLDKAETRVPLSDETDPFYVYAREAGLLWAYELALSVAMRARFHGLIGLESPDNTVSCWYGCVSQWPPEVVAEVQEWVNRTHVKGETVELPKAVKALVDQERSMREADDLNAEVASASASESDPCESRHLAGVQCENKLGHREARDPFEHAGTYKGEQVFWDGAFSSLRRCWSGEVVAAPPGVFGGGDLPTWERAPELLEANDNMLPKSMREHFQQDGSLWAYELAEAIVKHVSRIGLVKHEIGLETALAWYGAAWQWPQDVVAEVRAWLKLEHDVDQPSDVPRAVRAIVDQEIAMQQAEEVGESMWTTCGNQEAAGESE